MENTVRAVNGLLRNSQRRPSVGRIDFESVAGGDKITL